MQVRKTDPATSPHAQDNMRGWRSITISAKDVWYIISRSFDGPVGRMHPGFPKLVDRYAAEGLDLALLNDAVKGVPPVRGRDVLTYMRLVLDLATPRLQQAPAHDLIQGGHNEP